MSKITLPEIQSNHDLPAYQFLVQTLADLYSNYMYNARQLDGDAIYQVNLDDVGFFREWCDQEGFFAIEHLLPESDSLMQDILKYCIKISVK